MASTAGGKLKPRIIIHGGAGNIRRESMSADQYQQYRRSLLGIITSTDAYMRTPKGAPGKHPLSGPKYPSALEITTYAVVKLEDDPLFNSGHGAVFTRDGTNELEASVMVSRGFAKRGVGVTGLRTVRNPILLARAMLEHGERDLLGNTPVAEGLSGGDEADGAVPDVPSAQGHTLLHGGSAEALARKYGLETVDPSYFFTQRRWDEHVRGLERERQGGAPTWSADEYISQGTCGAVALDEDGVVCVATSTGGITNKLTGRIGDTPVVGAGFWAEEWREKGDPSAGAARRAADPRRSLVEYLEIPGPVVGLSSALYNLVSDCLPTPFMYEPVAPSETARANRAGGADVEVIRSTAVSGTGNGDSFLRVAAARSVASIARWAGVSSSDAVRRIAGRGGELETSAGSRWGKTGEGEGGMIGIECAIAVDRSGAVLYSRSEILQDHNCAGMFRAWIGDDGLPEMKIWHEDEGDHSEVWLASAIAEKY